MYICLCLALVQFLLSNNVADLEIPFPFKISLSNIYSFLSQLLHTVRFVMFGSKPQYVFEKLRKKQQKNISEFPRI